MLEWLDPHNNRSFNDRAMDVCVCVCMHDYVNIYACMNSHAMLRACMFRYCEHCERLSDIALELHLSNVEMVQRTIVFLFVTK